MANILRDLGNALNPLTSRNPVPSAVTRGMSTKYITSMIGTARAGKTVVADLIFYTARTLQQQLPDFHCTIDDQNSYIKNDIYQIENGHFPPKTKAYNKYAYQCALNMWWGKNSLWGQKSATFQNVDLAGEDLVIHSQYSSKKPDPVAYSQAAQLVDFIYHSDVFIPTAPADRAPIFDGNQSLDKEDDTAYTDSSDVKLSDIFDMIVKKRKERRQPIKGVILCLTKCDKIDKYVEKEHGWNLYNNVADRQAFLDLYYPWTSQSIKALRDTWSNTEILIVPMFVETVKNSDGTQKLWTSGKDEGQPIIAVEQRKPKYNAQACVDMINFIGRLVG